MIKRHPHQSKDPSRARAFADIVSRELHRQGRRPSARTDENTSHPATFLTRRPFPASTETLEPRGIPDGSSSDQHDFCGYTESDTDSPMTPPSSDPSLPESVDEYQRKPPRDGLSPVSFRPAREGLKRAPVARKRKASTGRRSKRRCQREKLLPSSSEPTPSSSPARTPLCGATEVKSPVTTAPCVSCASADASVRRLASENLRLRDEAERVEAEMVQQQQRNQADRELLLRNVAETHERRIRLIKEELDAKRAQEQAGVAAEQKAYKEKEVKMTQEVDEMKQKVQAAEASMTSIQQRAKRLESQLEAESKQSQSAKDQIAASLSTVAQFAEKHAVLERELELVRRRYEHEKHQGSLLNTQLGEMKNAVERASQKQVEAKNSHAELATSLMHRDAEIAQLKRELSASRADVARSKKETEEVSSSLSRVQDKLKESHMQYKTLLARHDQLKREYSALHKRHDESLSLAKCAWDEASAVKQENSLLRSQLTQQESTTEQLKRLTAKRFQHQRARAPLMSPLGASSSSPVHDEDESESLPPSHSPPPAPATLSPKTLQLPRPRTSPLSLPFQPPPLPPPPRSLPVPSPARTGLPPQMNQDALEWQPPPHVLMWNARRASAAARLPPAAPIRAPPRSPQGGLPSNEPRCAPRGCEGAAAKVLVAQVDSDPEMQMLMNETEASCVRPMDTADLTTQSTREGVGLMEDDEKGLQPLTATTSRGPSEDVSSKFLEQDGELQREPEKTSTQKSGVVSASSESSPSRALSPLARKTLGRIRDSNTPRVSARASRSSLSTNNELVGWRDRDSGGESSSRTNASSARSNLSYETTRLVKIKESDGKCRYELRKVIC